MSRKMLYGMILLILLILVFILNEGDVDVKVLFVTFEIQKSLAFLIFTCAGGVVGGLLFR